MLRQEGHIPKEISILPEVVFTEAMAHAIPLLFCGVLWRLWQEFLGENQKNLSDLNISVTVA